METVDEADSEVANAAAETADLREADPHMVAEVLRAQAAALRDFAGIEDEILPERSLGFFRVPIFFSQT